MSIQKVKKVMSSFEPTEVQNYQITYESGEVWYCPLSDNNRHYREVLEWVAEGNTIEPEDE